MVDRRYFGCYVKQRDDNDTTRFFVFVVKVKDLLQWVGTQRTEEVEKGIQRILRPTRVKAIKRFLGSNSKNTIPNSVLVAFEPGKATFAPMEDQAFETEEIKNNCGDKLQWGILDFSFDPEGAEHERPGLVVDGQHRINGIASFENEDLPVLVVALVNADHQEQAFQFMVVNSKAVKVPTENVKSIVADFDEEALKERLLQAGIRYGDVSPKLRDINDLSISPFQNLLDWPYNRGGTKLVSVLTIEQGLRFLDANFGNVIGDDDDTEVAIFCAIWLGVKNTYEDLWGEENKLMAKVSLSALNEYIISRLKLLWSMDSLDIFSADEVTEQTSKILRPIKDDYWKTEWRVPLQDTAGFKQFIKEDLERMSENPKLNKQWLEELQLPEIKS